MMKYLLGSAGIIALSTGAAMAQDQATGMTAGAGAAASADQAAAEGGIGDIAGQPGGEPGRPHLRYAPSAQDGRCAGAGELLIGVRCG